MTAAAAGTTAQKTTSRRPDPDGAVDDADRLVLTFGRLRTIYIADTAVDATLFHLGPYVTTSARSPLCARAILAERVLPSPTCSDTRSSRRRSFKMPPRRRQPRSPPHHPRVQHGTSPVTRPPLRTIAFPQIPHYQRRRPTTTIDQRH